MLVTPMFNGMGLGNQLFCYITTRCLALDKGYDFGVVYPERFKGKFMALDLPEVKGFDFPIEGREPLTMPKEYTYYAEKAVFLPNGADIRPVDEQIMNIGDNTCIHGCLQYMFEDKKDLIREWLKVEPLELPNDLCIINFRGGEYVWVPDFFLRKEYWQNAVDHMLKVNPNMRFEVHTDDPHTASQFFPSYKIVHDIALNWRSIRYAKYLILSNSTFALYPAWLNEEVKLIIAPKYFNRHNISDGYWSLETNLIKGFMYMDRNGNLSDYETCKKELNEYKNK